MERLPLRILPAVVEFLYGPLAKDPARVGKRLREPLNGFFGARRGGYRVIYEVVDGESTVIVHRVAHRSDAYRM